MSNKKKIVIGLSVIVISLISSTSYYKFYYLKYVAPYRFWNDFLSKDKKPLFVSLKEYQDKNEQGFCWRDKRFYSKEELKEKAMKSLLKRLSYGMKVYSSGKSVWGADDQFQLENEWHCNKRNRRNNGKYCYILGINGEMTNQEFINLINEIPSNADDETIVKSRYWKIFNDRIVESNMNLEQPEKWKTYSSESDVDKNVFDFKRNVVLIEKLPYDHNHFYGSDCCNIINKSEFKQLSDYHLSNGRMTSDDDNVFYSHLVGIKSLNTWTNLNDVIDADIRKSELNPKYGNSNFYLNINYVHQRIKVQYDEVRHIELGKPATYIRNYVLVMNNCGDVLYSPYNTTSSFPTRRSPWLPSQKTRGS